MKLKDCTKEELIYVIERLQLYNPSQKHFLFRALNDVEMRREEKKFDEAMDDDFNTADAISAIFELVKFANSNADENSGAAFVRALKEKITGLADICGLVVERSEEILDSEIESLIAQRQEARKEKDFKRADEIRDILAGKGIILEDTREGVKWKRA